MTTRFSAPLIPALVISSLSLAACDQNSLDTDGTIRMLCDTTSETGLDCQPAAEQICDDASETGFDCSTLVGSPSRDIVRDDISAATTCDDASETGFNCPTLIGGTPHDYDDDGFPATIDCDDHNPHINDLLYVDQRTTGDIWVCRYRS